MPVIAQASDTQPRAKSSVVNITGEPKYVLRLGPQFKPTLECILSTADVSCAVQVQAREETSRPVDQAGFALRKAVHNGVEGTWANKPGENGVIVTIRTPTAFVRNAETFHEKLEKALIKLVSNNRTNNSANTGDSDVNSGNATAHNPGGAPTNGAGAAPPAKSDGDASAALLDRVNEYLEAHNLSITAFAEKCDVSNTVIYRLQKGQGISGASERQILAILEGRSLPHADSQPSTPVFDPTCEKLITMVIEHAVEKERLDTLLGYVFNRMQKIEAMQGTDFVKTMLRRYVAAEAEDERLTALLDLRDQMKK